MDEFASPKRRPRRLLLVCSYCNRFKSESGSWDRVLQIHQADRDAEISHGICPTCLQEQFPKEYALLQAEGRLAA